MNIWIPDLGFRGGATIYNQRLTALLRSLGHNVEVTRFTSKHQLNPFFLSFKKPNQTPDVVIADVISGAMFRNVAPKLIVIEHHCIFDPAYLPFKSWIQKLVHNILWRSYERRSLLAADQIVCVSNYTAKSTRAVFGDLPITTIPNAVDTNLYCPAARPKDKKRVFKLLYVGNLTHRKGFDLLPKIMDQLGDEFELRYTSGLRTKNALRNLPNIMSLGRLTEKELIREYQQADLFVFPTRFEGFGYSPAEAMSCGTPVVSTQCSSIPEVIVDGETGFLCPIDDVSCFVDSIKRLSSDEKIYQGMRQKARLVATQRFAIEQWGNAWTNLLQNITLTQLSKERLLDRK
jgi:glycosyltransferase involved in cell wall biosynthesis